MPATPLNVVSDWFARLLEKEDFSMTHIPLAASREWALGNGAIRHKSGRFFAVVGIHAMHADGNRVEQPLLDQREVGTLAFVIRPYAESTEVLVQAKVEPGNIGTIQLAPSFQATASNAACIHGGTPPPLHELISRASKSLLVADSLQSEQGSRFYGKFNRNCSLLVSGEVSHGPYHRWMPARELCGLLAENYLINTDARSSLVCSDWEILAKGQPFSGHGFAAELLASYRLADSDAYKPLQAVLCELNEPAAWRDAPKIQSLDQLLGWKVSEEGPEPEAGKPFRLRHIQVHALSREVTEWDQPIVQSAGCGQVALPIGRYHGIPHFLFRTSCEPGFGSRVELTPALTAQPGESHSDDAFTSDLLISGRQIISCLQSEEGGRFLFDENNYVLLDVGDVMQPPNGYHWVSLAQIRELLARGKCLTNEARSVLSLLLTWL